MQRILLTLLIVLVCFTKTNQASWGPCGTKPLQQNFSINEYLGTWYEIERSGKVDEKHSCISEKYSMNGNRVELLTRLTKEDGSVEVFEGELYLPPKKEKEKAKCSFRIASGRLDQWTRFEFPQDIPMKYWIFATDYTSYSLVYSCTSIFGVAHNDYIWILSRERHLSQNTTDYLYNIMSEHNVKTDNLFKIHQKGCIF